MSRKDSFKFPGFEPPEQNYSKMPHSFIECLAVIDTVAELKVVMYLLRHTWGFSEYGKPKRITTDEFMHGRKRKDGRRLDSGTGLSNNSVITGLEKAAEHGFILVETDDSDKGRIKKYYRLNMAADQDELEPDIQTLQPDVQNLHTSYAKSTHRSEKETKERKSSSKKKEEEETAGDVFSIFKMYEEEFFAKPSPTMKRTISDAVNTYSAEWVRAAIRETVFHGGKSWRYVAKVLEQWDRDGFQEKDAKHKARDLAKGNPPSRKTDPQPAWMDKMRKRVEANY